MASSSSLAPSFLLSMPQLVDPNFARTVVLLCKHSEEGAFGLIVNRPLLTSGRIVVNVEPAEEAGRAAAARESIEPEHDLQVWIGGPVEPQRSWILVGAEPDREGDRRGMRIAQSLYLSTDPDLLRRLLEPSPPYHARLVIGYSGWGPGQLEAELRASAWLIS